MTEFVVTIDDPDLLAAVTWARERHNIGAPKDAAIAKDGEYVQQTVLRAAASWAAKRRDPMVAAEVVREAALAERDAAHEARAQAEAERDQALADKAAAEAERAAVLEARPAAVLDA